MKQDRITLTAGFLPAVVMALMMLLEQLLATGTLPKNVWVIAGAEVLIFLLPILLLRFLRNKDGKRAVLRFRSYKRQTGWFVLWMSLMAAALTMLISGGITLLLDLPQSGSLFSKGFGLDSFWKALLIAVVLPAVLEELFFRGVLFSALEAGGTLPAILLTSEAFAMVHGDPRSFPAPLAAGLIYGYLCYVLNSVWPAIFAHLINNLAMLLLSHAARTYSALGIWPYILLITGFLFCMFLALSMRTLEKQIERKRILRLQHRSWRETLCAIFISPGLWLLLILFLIRILYE